MTSEFRRPDLTELKPRITVFGVGGGGGNAVNNMINSGLQGVDFIVANTDAQALAATKSEKWIQLGSATTQGLGAGAMPEMGRAAAEECEEEIKAHLANYHMVFITAGMGGGTGTGAAPVIARIAKERGILTVGVVTKPFDFEGVRRMKTAEEGIKELQECVDTLIVIPNQNLFRIANEKTTFAESFNMADQVLYSGVASITDLMIKEGLINLDFADVRSVMTNMGRAMMGTGEATGEGRALKAAEAAIANPLLDETSMQGARGLLISITGGQDMTLFEVDEAANRIRQEVDAEADVIFGAIHDPSLDGVLRVSVVATGITNGNKRGTNNYDNNSKSYGISQRPVHDVNPITKPVENDIKMVAESILEPIKQASAVEKAKGTLPTKEEVTVKEEVAEEKSIDLKLESKIEASLLQPKEDLEEVSIIPSLEDFSPIARRSYEAAKKGDVPFSPTRGLWSKLIENFKGKKHSNDVAALEPLEEVFVKKATPFAENDIKKIKSPVRESYSLNVEESESLEIPAFLRRRAN